VYAARFLKTLVNQIKVNEFVPFDMVISVSLPPSFSPRPVLLFTDAERERERKEHTFLVLVLFSRKLSSYSITRN